MPHSFIRLIATRCLFTFAVQMQAVIVAWQIYALTHDPLMLGLVGLAEAVPALSLALYGGLLVDRGNPLFIYRVVLILSLLSGVALIVSHLPWVVLGLNAQLTTLYMASVVTGIARAFSQPAMFSLVPQLVARLNLTEAAAWMSSSMQVARVAGPALGGVVYGYFGMLTAITAVCILLAVGIVLISSLQLAPQAPTTTEAAQPKTQAFFGGLTFVWQHPILLPALSLDMICVLFGGVTAVLPIYAEQVLHLGAGGLGLLRAAPAVGSAIGSLTLMRLPIKQHAGVWLLSAVCGFGLCILVFGISTNLIVSVLALGLSGAFDSVSMLVRTVVVQLASPEHMRGRIAAVNSMFIGSSNELGEFESGVAARLLGTVASVVVGGCICLVTVASIAVVSPALRQLNLRRFDEAKSRQS